MIIFEKPQYKCCTRGGRLATKPYVSSATYIDRMGDHCKACHYDRKARTGERACPFNALYWDFFARHAERLRGNHRLSMVYRNLDRMDAATLEDLRQQAAQTMAGMEKR